MQEQAARELVEDVAVVLGPDFYIYADEGDHFLGEAAMVALAGSLLVAFWKGVAAGLNGEAEEWGKSAGSWLANRLRNVIARSKGAGRAAAASEAAAEVSAAAASKVDPIMIAEQFDLAEKLLARALKDSGQPAHVAARYAAAVRAAAAAVAAG